MGTKLAKPPVFFTAAQVRHNTILSLDKFATQLQEEFRNIGYPDYKAKVLQGFELVSSDAGEIKVVQKVARQHTFMNIDRTEGFIVDGDRIYFQITNYDVFETFRDQFLKGITTLHSVVELAYIDTIGMRLLDAIIPEENELLSQYVAAQLQGMGEALNAPGWKLDHSATEAVISTGSHTIFVRTLSRFGKLAVAADLNISDMTLLPQFSNLSGIHAILDMDCIRESREKFDVEYITSHLRLLKDDLNTAFETAVTPYALQKWR